MRNSDNFPRDILGRENKIDTPAGYRGPRHVRVRRRIEFLGDGYAADVFYAAERRGSVPVIARNDDRDQLAVPVLLLGTQKHSNYVGPSSGL